MAKKITERILVILCAAAMCIGGCLFAACSGGTADDVTDDSVQKVTTKFLDVPYVEDATSYQYLDVELPTEGEGPFPLVVYIHGGGFTGNKRRIGLLEPTFKQLKQDGYAVAYVDYTLSQMSDDGTELLVNSFPQMIHDVNASIRFLKAHSTEYNIDPDNMVLLGDSAGAHLSLLSAATDGKEYYTDLSMGNAEYTSTVKGVVSVSGSCLYSYEDEFTQSALEILVGSEYTEEDFERVSPYCQATDKMVPVFLAHGQTDETVPVDQSYAMQKKLEGLIGEDNVKTYYPEIASHVDIKVFNSDEFIGMVEDFLEYVL